MLGFLNNDFLNRSHTKYNHNHKFLPLIGGWSLDLDSVELDKENRKLTALICQAGNTIVSMEYFELPFHKDNSKQCLLKETATYSFQTQSYIKRKRPEELSKFEHESAISRVYNLYQNEFGSNIQGGINSIWRFVEAGGVQYYYDINSILYNNDKSVRVIVSDMIDGYIHEYAIIMYADKNNNIKVLEEAVFDSQGIRVDTHYYSDLFWAWKDVFIKMYDDIINTGLELKKSSGISPDMGEDYRLMQCRLILSGLVGMTSAKEQIMKQCKYIVGLQKRNAKNTNQYEEMMPLHMLLLGNPGCGKTEFARVLSKIYSVLGIFSGEKFREIGRKDLIAKWQGHTAKKVEEVFNEAQGGIIFIDEAYSLASDRLDTFEKEAVATLIQLMENKKTGYAMILAGYRDKMMEFLDTNPGLKSRFPTVLDFPDYTEAELTEIVIKFFKKDNYILEDKFISELSKYVKIKKHQQGKNAGNARLARNIYDEIKAEQIARTSSLNDSNAMKTVTVDDIPHQNRAGETLSFNLEEELSKIIGLDNVKDTLRSLQNTLIVNQKKKELGLEVNAFPALNMVFKGNQGTGKTTVARLVSKILFNIGVMPRDISVEVFAQELIANRSGATSEKTANIINSAIGGVLFIDEAYSLLSSDYGQEAIDTLVKEIEDNKGSLVVIIAGYPEPIEKFIDANTGLASRFPFVIDFPDYSVDELLEIAKKMYGKYLLNLDTENAIKWRMNKEKQDPRFGNARAVRNMVEESERNQSNRLANDFDVTMLTEKDALTITASDILGKDYDIFMSSNKKGI